MAELFNVDLPPRFQYKPGSEEESKREVEEYLERLSSSIDEMLKRVFNRLDSKDLWEIDGTETQLVTADEIDMQSKKIINLTDPAAAQHAATKASSEAAATAAGLWEVDGTEHQLKTADAIDMQSQKIINLTDPGADQEAATKKFHDDDMNAKMNTTTGHDHDGTDSKKVSYSDLDGAPASSGIPSNIQVFTSNGTWTKPAGVSVVYVKLWGAGGNGYAGQGNANPGAGGGGGGYSEGLVEVTGNITVTVGTGTSSFAGETTLQATAGGVANGLSGGSAGVGSNGTINLTAQASQDAFNGNENKGGCGGSSPFGGSGGEGGAGDVSAPGQEGGFPGGGGGGGAGGAGAAGAKANGLVIVMY